jgi:hypothetical protein
MILRIDLGTAPPELTLVDGDDFKSFKAEVVLGPHTWVAPEALERLGPPDEEWKEGLQAMMDFAAPNGWTDERGRVRAHVDLVDVRPGDEAG